MSKRVLLVILDGFGYSKEKEHNAIYLAKTSFWDEVWNKYPRALLEASGEAVGLFPGQIGSSEVGHMNIGAGRVVLQELTKIHRSIDDRSFYENPVFLEAVEHAKKYNSSLHLLGLVSPGGVHSHSHHLYALIKLARDKKLDRVFIHAYLDGRDTPPSSALAYISELEEVIEETAVGRIATLCGRFYAMDRNENWHHTAKTYEALVEGKGADFKTSAAAISASYEKRVTDEFIEPVVLVNDVGSKDLIRDNDSIIFFNFRADRMRQIAKTFIDRQMDILKDRYKPQNLFIATMIPYDAWGDVRVAFKRETPQNILSEVLSQNGVSQLKIAETQKYAHLTYFFNNTREEPFDGEDRIMIPSKDVATYDLMPEMSAYEVTEAARKSLDRGYGVIMINYANPDMVGHTANLKATIKAIEVVDECLARLIVEAKKFGYTVIITADHGNAEQLFDPKSSERYTAHTLNPVPFVVINDRNIKIKSRGILGDVAPTILKITGVKKPEEMTGEPLI